MMKVLVVGASGATGQRVVELLLNREVKVSVITRTPHSLPANLKQHPLLTELHASIHDATDAEMRSYVNGCDAVISCLGHNLTFKGIFGKPRRLVTDSVRRLCNAIEENAIEENRSSHSVPENSNSSIKFILMNTTGNSNRDISEKISLGQRCVLALLRLLLPPHVDNEKAADVLRTEVGQNNSHIEWAAVRPDGLTDEDHVTDYEVYPSPIRDAIFDAGTTSRINVGHFMADLVCSDELWQRWKGKMPVIYNKEQPAKA